MKKLLLLFLGLTVFSSFAQISKKPQSNRDHKKLVSQQGNKNILTHRKSILGSDNILTFLNSDFEDPEFPPNGWTIEYEWMNEWFRSLDVSGYGIGTASACFEFWISEVGTVQSLVTNTFSPAVAGDTLSFDEAYATYIDQIDSLQILTSKDGGGRWVVLATLPGGISGELVTAPPSAEEFFPRSSEWATKKYALPLGVNKIKFTAISQFGNNLFLDNIRVGNPPTADAGIVSISTDTLVFLGTTTPKVTVKNFGTAAITNVPVTLKINPGGYSFTQNISSLDPGASSEVSFNDWTATEGTYDFMAYTSLTGDQDILNDTLYKKVYAKKGISNYSGWSSLTNLTAPKWANASVFVRKGIAPDDTGFVYSIGGFDENMSVTTDVVRLNLKSNRWEVMTSIPEGLYQGSAIVVGKKIFVPGGYNTSSTASDSLYIYDIPSDTWTTGAPLPTAVAEYAIGTYNHKVYLFDGGNLSSMYNLVQVYDIATNSWSLSTPVPGFPLAGLKGAIVGNTIILSGGFDIANLTEVATSYKGVINEDGSITWSSIPDYPSGLVYGHAAGAPFVYSQPDARYVIFTSGSARSVEAYTATWAWDTHTDTWLFAGFKPSPISYQNDFVGITRNDSLFMVSVGGFFNGTTSNTVEALGIGLESALNVPVELTQFTADVEGNSVNLKWTTATEINNKGFSILRKSGNNPSEEVAFISGKGTTVKNSSYSFSDKNLAEGKYTYTLKQVDFNGTTTMSKSIEVDVTPVNEFALLQNYPNPFNPSTRINFSLAVDSKVSFRVFNLLGEVVYSSNENLSSGTHYFNFNGSGLSSGIYFYKLEASGVDGTNFSSVKKMLLIK